MTTTDRNLARNPAQLESALDHEAAVAPGRTTRTERLAGPGPVLTSGIILRKAERDDNGVAAGASDAIAAAGSSSGSPLPSAIAAQFGGSLGADLSQVRVHTGRESAAAAEAISARAFATGTDIHFAAGQYAPDTDRGKHLLAHEVAHTVQQQSGGATGRQMKLEVSTPGDALETEADRAADAMVTGKAAQLSFASGLQRAIYRDYDNDLNKAADAGQQDAQAAGPDHVLSLTTAEDSESAEKLLKMIESWIPDMDKAVESKDATSLDLKINNNAKMKLQDFLGAMQGEDLGLANFKTLYKRVQVDYARLDAMGAQAGSSIGDKNQDKGVNAASGTDLAKDNIDDAAGKADATSSVAARAEKIANTPGNEALKAALLGLKNDKAPLDAQQSKVTTAERQSTNAVTGINNARNLIIAVESQIKSAALKAEFEKAKKEVEENKEKVKQVCEVLGTALEAAADPEKALETIGIKAVEMLGPVVATALGLPGLTVSAEDEAKGQQGDAQADQAAVAAYNNAKGAYATAAQAAKLNVSAFVNELKTLDEQKRAHKTKLAELGAAMDAAEAKMPGAKKKKPGELGTFQTITLFLGEADGFIADAKTCKDVGQKELSRSDSGSAGQIENKARYEAGSFQVRIPNKRRIGDPDGKARFDLASQTLTLGTGGEGSASDSGKEAGANTTVQEACHAIDKFIEEIEAYRVELRKALDAA